MRQSVISWSTLLLSLGVAHTPCLLAMAALALSATGLSSRQTATHISPLSLSLMATSVGILTARGITIWREIKAHHHNKQLPNTEDMILVVGDAESSSKSISQWVQASTNQHRRFNGLKRQFSRSSFWKNMAWGAATLNLATWWLLPNQHHHTTSSYALVKPTTTLWLMKDPIHQTIENELENLAEHPNLRGNKTRVEPATSSIKISTPQGDDSIIDLTTMRIPTHQLGVFMRFPLADGDTVIVRTCPHHNYMVVGVMDTNQDGTITAPKLTSTTPLQLIINQHTRTN